MMDGGTLIFLSQVSSSALVLVLEKLAGHTIGSKA